MIVVQTQQLDPWRNLAVEDYLLGQAEKLREILFLWRSENAVVIGKNQNPWRECRAERLQAEGAALARRVSGGGAVYHDRGNLNFSFFTRRVDYDEARQFEALVDALGAVGIDAHRVGRNSLFVGDRKVSGNAFCFRRGGALHHGSILVSTDLAKLKRYLRRSKHIIRTRAVASNPAPVANLTEYAPSLEMDSLQQALVCAFSDRFARVMDTLDDDWLNVPEVRRLRAKYASWDWRFRLTPPFDIAMAADFEIGHVRVLLYVDEAVITHTAVTIEGRGEAAAHVIEDALCGCPLDASEVRDRLRALPLPCDETVARQLADWIVNV